MQRGLKVTGEKIHSRWLANNRGRPDAQLRLFCFPYAGGSAATFRTWHDGLPGSIENYSVQLPGRGGRLSEPPFHRLGETIEELGRALSPFFDKPFAFFGHSMGAIIAFELSRWLRREKKVMPIHLFVSGRRAPPLPETETHAYNLPDPEFIARLRRLNGTPPDVIDHPELMQLMMPLLRADFSVCETYEYRAEPPLECPLTVFGGIEDAEAPSGELQSWRELTTSVFSLHMFPGDHFFIHTAQAEMLRIIAQKLVPATRL